MTPWMIEREVDTVLEEALAALTPHQRAGLRDEVINEAVATVQAIEEDGWCQAWVLADLASHLPADLRDKALKEALVAVRAIGDERRRGEALADLAPHLPLGLLRGALTIAWAIEQELVRAEALEQLTPRLQALPFVTAYSLFRDSLVVLSARARQDMLTDIRVLEPVVAELGGVKAVEETFRAIQDVGRWWP